MIYRYDELKQYIQNEFEMEGVYMELEDSLEHVDAKVLQQELKDEYSMFLCDIDILKEVGFLNKLVFVKD